MALGTLPLQDIEQSLFEIESMGDRLIGYEIGSNINGMNLDNEYFYRIYSKCEEMGKILFVHPWDMMGQDQMSDYWLPWLVGMPAETSRAICSMIFGGIFDKFPKLKVVFAHGGGSFCGTIGRIQHGYNVRPDLCGCKCNSSPIEYCGKFYVDSLVHSGDELDRIIRLFGENNVVLGTDYPFPLGESVPGKIIMDRIKDGTLVDKLKKKNTLELIYK